MRLLPRGRKALDTDTRPGQVLLLALLAAAPIALAFVAAPLALEGRTTPFLVRVVLFGTPVVAVWSLVVFFRAPADKRAHRASRIGVLLDGVSLFLWVLVLIPALMGRV